MQTINFEGKPPYRLIIGWTNWKFGQANINILVLSIAYGGINFPILYRMMPKRGASNINKRIEIMEHYIQLFGKETNKSIFAKKIMIMSKKDLQETDYNPFKDIIRRLDDIEKKISEIHSSLKKLSDSVIENLNRDK